MLEHWNQNAYVQRQLPWFQERFASKLVPFAAGRRVLELGCGGGALASYLAAAGATVVGVDFSPAMLDLARATFAESSRLRFEQGDILQLDLGERFDLICGAAVLHEIPVAAYPALIDTLKRHLDEGASAWFLENSYFNPLFRIFREHLVGRWGIPQFGSVHETPFDPERFGMLQHAFEYASRSGDIFLLFRQLNDYIFRFRAPFLNPIDMWVSAVPTAGTLKRWLSFLQLVYLSDAVPPLSR